MKQLVFIVVAKSFDPMFTAGSRMQSQKKGCPKGILFLSRRLG
jgi:hypothetical protein